MTTRRRRYRLRLWHLMALMPVAALATVWFVLPPGGPTAPVSLVRGPDQRLVPERGDPGKVGGLGTQAASIEAETNFRGGSSGRGGDPPRRFDDRSLLILNLSDHPLLRRVGGALLDEFEAYEPLKRVDFLPPGYVPDPGRYAPDLILTLELLDIAEDAGPFRREVDATIAVRMFNEASRGDISNVLLYERGEVMIPPLSKVQSNYKYEHSSVTTGPVPAPARYELAGRAIAEEMALRLIATLREWVDGDGRMPELPDSFRPPYREPEAMPTLDDLGAERIYSTRGLMRHNTTAWRFDDDRLSPVVLDDLRVRFTSLGWEESTRGPRRGPSLTLKHSEGMNFVTVRRVEPVRSNVPPDPDEPTTFEILYVDQMTRAEASVAAEPLISEGTPIETLLLLQRAFDQDQMRRALDLVIAAEPPAETLFPMRRYFTQPQRLRVLDLLESRGVSEPGHRMRMAEIQLDAGRADEALEIYRELVRELGWPREPFEQFERVLDLERSGLREEAVQALRESLVLQQATMQSMLGEFIWAKARELDVDYGSLREGVEDETLRALGFVEIGPDADLPPRTVAPGDLLLFFARPPEGEGEPRLFSLHLRPDGQQVAWAEREDGGGGSATWSSTESSKPLVKDWSARDDLQVTFRLDPEGDGGDLRLSIETHSLPGLSGTSDGP